MVISQATECAIRALMYVAGFPVGRIVTKREICRTQEITPGFLIKIMQPLIAGGLARSYRGIAGGFSLGKPSEEISLWDIISAVEGPIYLNKCMIHAGYCPRDTTCPVHTVWHKVREQLKQSLSQVTLAELIKQTKL